MGRPYRHVQPGGSHFEITTRALQSRFLLPVGAHFRSIAIGILARAKERYPVDLYAFGGLSNHLHLLLGAHKVKDLAGFMCFVKSNLAREAGRIVDWNEKFWGRRYRAIKISDQEAAWSNLARGAGRIVDWNEKFWGRRYRAIEISDQEAAWIERLRYVLSHGPKENLVLRCRDWPGLQCIDALTKGAPLEGIWRDRSLEYEAHRRGQEVEPEAFLQRYTLELDPLPCWRHLSAEEIRRQISEMVDDIDAETALRVVLNGRAPLGVEAIRKQNPHHRPVRTKKSPAPAVHAASKPVRKMMREAYRLFVEAYREASARLRAGDWTVEFPPGCFPPARPFAPAEAGLPIVRAGPARTPG